MTHTSRSNVKKLLGWCISFFSRRLHVLPTWRPGGLTKSVISKVIIRVTPFRVLITLLITHLLSPLGLQVNPINRKL